MPTEHRPRNLLVTFPHSGGLWLVLMLRTLGIEVIGRHFGNGHGHKRPFRPFAARTRDADHLVGVFRDPRDVAVSGYWQVTTRSPMTRTTMGDFVLHPNHGIEKQMHFNLSLMDAVSGHRDARSVTYETVHSDTVAVVHSMSQWLGRQVSLDDARAAVDENSFAKLHAREVAGEFEGIAMNGSPIRAVPDKPNSFRFRQGVAGSHRKEMPPDVIATCDAILAHYDYWPRLHRHIERYGLPQGPGTRDR